MSTKAVLMEIDSDVEENVSLDHDRYESDADADEKDFIGDPSRPYNKATDVNSKFSFPGRKVIHLTLSAKMDRCPCLSRALPELVRDWLTPFATY